MEPSVYPGSSHKDGGCNFCSMTTDAEVFVVRGRGLQVRFCGPCIASVMRQVVWHARRVLAGVLGPELPKIYARISRGSPMT